MNELIKKILKVSLVLGAISSISAGVIGLANAVTAPKIKENAKKKELSSLPQIFGGTSDDYEEVTYDGNSLTDKYELTYTLKQWKYEGNSEYKGSYIFKSYGKNSYGTVTLLVGITSEVKLYNIYLIEDTESYKSVLEPNYVDAYNNSNNKEESLENVKCGATYGATMIRDMVKEALSIVKGEAKEKSALAVKGGN